jgi:hypothetical protein
MVDRIPVLQMKEADPYSWVLDLLLNPYLGFTVNLMEWWGGGVVLDWDPVTCPWHVTYEQFCALPPSSDRWIKNQRPDAMNSTRLQCRPQCTATVHRLKSVDCAYATELSIVHCYSILILAVHFQPNDPDRKAPNYSSVTCPWHVTGSQSGGAVEGKGMRGEKCWDNDLTKVE